MYLWHKEKQISTGNNQQKELPVCCSSVPGSPMGAGSSCSVSAPDQSSSAIQSSLGLGSRNALLLMPATWAAVAHTLSQCLSSHLAILPYWHKSERLTLSNPLGKD